MNQCSKSLYLLFAFLLVMTWCAIGANGNQAKHGRGSQIVFSDSDFLPSDWNETLILSLYGGTYSSSQENSGGNPSSYRYIVHSMPAPPHGTQTQIWVLHTLARATFSPSLSGAIDSLTYSEDQIEFSPPFSGAKIGDFIALRQDNSDYLLYNHEDFGFTNTYWNTVAASGLTANDFVEFSGVTGAVLVDTASHPDFTSNGGSIEFGCLRWNSTGNGCVTYHGYDNWSVTLHLRADYLCGDADGDGSVNIADVVFLLEYIFSDGAAPSPLAAGDANCDNGVNIADCVYLIAYIFSGGPAPCAGCK